MFWILIVAALLLTRVPATPEYLHGDNINIAFAMEKFDPRIHQPQPPGYPFFIAFARFVNIFVRDVEKTMGFLAVLASVLCLPLMGALGSRMFNPWVGQAGALLLLVNPVFWFSGLEGPIRPFLAVFALMSAYCAWRAWHEEHRYVIWGAVALGIGSGFRPDLLAFLGPVWLISAWVGTRSFRYLLAGSSVLAVVILIWVGTLVYVVGGIRALYDLNTNYLVVQSRAESMVLGASTPAWLRQMSRLVVWNGLAIIGWVWAVTFLPFSRNRWPWRTDYIGFFAWWLTPGLVSQALIHVAAPGHTLFSVPAWCLMGAQVLWVATSRLQKKGRGELHSGCRGMPRDSGSLKHDAVSWFYTSIGCFFWWRRGRGNICHI